VPRQLQEQALEVRKAIDERGDELGRSPTVAELSGHLDLDEEAVIDTLMARDSQNALSLDREAPGDEPGTTLGENTGAEDPGLEAVDAQLAAERCACLDVREREVLALRFGSEELSQREIGERIGVSQMQVSRIMRRALAKLLEAVQGEESPDGERTLEAARKAG
jgi:RNA polymerase sigma-B factor